MGGSDQKRNYHKYKPSVSELDLEYAAINGTDPSYPEMRQRLQPSKPPQLRMSISLSTQLEMLSDDQLGLACTLQHEVNSFEASVIWFKRTLKT